MNKWKGIKDLKLKGTVPQKKIFPSIHFFGFEIDAFLAPRSGRKLPQNRNEGVK